MYWGMQDANWNVLGLVDSSGNLKERYEYTPYGQRTVFFGPGGNDLGCYAPTFGSRRFVTSGSVTQPYAICEFGHQGLIHDEAETLVHNRARLLHSMLAIFCQRDPLDYIDGNSLYRYLNSQPTGRVDPSGQSWLFLFADSPRWKHKCILLPTANRHWEGAWTRWMLQPKDPGVGTAMFPGAAMTQAEPVAHFVKRFQEKFECCDCNGTRFFVYGSPKYLFGSAGIPANNQVLTFSAIGGYIPVPLPGNGSLDLTIGHGWTGGANPKFPYNVGPDPATLWEHDTSWGRHGLPANSVLVTTLPCTGTPRPNARPQAFPPYPTFGSGPKGEYLPGIDATAPVWP
jgi:RHS repeat-associated protein